MPTDDKPVVFTSLLGRAWQDDEQTWRDAQEESDRQWRLSQRRWDRVWLLGVFLAALAAGYFLGRTH